MSSKRFPAAVAARPMRLVSLAALVALPFASAVAVDPAVSTVAAFNGSLPAGNIVVGNDGAIYGTTAPSTTASGGLVYRVVPDGSSVTTIHQINKDTEGQTPQAGLMIASDGKFYGTTKFGITGTFDTSGTIFRLNQDGSSFEILHRFAPFTDANSAASPKNTNGAYPGSELIEGPDGRLYGATGAGGANGTGVIYSLNKDGSGFQVLHVFSALAGRNVARVVKSGTATATAGTTVSTGSNQTVGRMPFDATHTRMTVRVASPTVGIKVRLKVEESANSAHSAETEATTTVANAWETLTFDFANPASGTPALDFSYNYDKVSIYFDYGTTGATAGSKTYFFDDVTFLNDGGTFSPITFDATGVTYTLTGFGGAESSTVVSDPLDLVIRNTEGMSVNGPLVRAPADGWFYGTASAGGQNGLGTVFRYNTSTDVFEVVHTFTATTTDATTKLVTNVDGATPLAGLTVVDDPSDPTNNFLYGLASTAGGKSYGTIFRISTKTQAFTKLHDFDGLNGARPAAELVLFTNGKLYGTTVSGGKDASGTATSYGTLFSYALDGTGFTLLHSLDGKSGASPGAPLIQLSDTVIIGSATTGSSCGSGGIFRYDSTGGTVTGNTKCGRKKGNAYGGSGATGPAVLLLLGGLAFARRRRR